MVYTFTMHLYTYVAEFSACMYAYIAYIYYSEFSVDSNNSFMTFWFGHQYEL